MTRPPSPSMVTFTPGSSTSTTSVPSGVKMRITVAREVGDAGGFGQGQAADASSRTARRRRRPSGGAVRERRGASRRPRSRRGDRAPAAATTDGCCTWARCRPSSSATSAADWIAVGRVLGVQLGDDRDQPVGDLGIDLADRRRRLLADALEDGHRCRWRGTAAGRCTWRRARCPG